MSQITITNLERDCIACPTAWTAQTESNGDLYIRYRGGELKIRKTDEERTQVYSDTLGGPFDGHITVYDLMEKLPEETFKFTVDVPTTYYSYPAENCIFDMLGTWIQSVSCDNCQWKKQPDELQTLEYETVLPPECPNCSSDYTIETEPPEHFKEMNEQLSNKDQEEIVSNLKEEFSQDN